MPTREELALRYMFDSKATRALRKQAKRNHEPDAVRRKDWQRLDLEDPETYDELDVPDEERVMPRGEYERRRAVLAAVSATAEDRPAAEGDGGLNDAASGESVPSEPGHHMTRQRGMVIEVSPRLCRVELPGRSLVCTLRGSLTAGDTRFTNAVAVGDQVVISVNGSDQGVVEQVLPRRSVLARPDVYYNHLQQMIAANLDQLLVVAAWREPAFWPELADRYLITAERNRLEPILCVNKIDLAEDLPACQAALQPYQKLGYRVIFASAVTLAGIDELRSVLAGKSTVLAGLSGVGKSSLLSAAQPGLELRTHEVSERRHEGQHTTSQASLHRLEGGGYVVDTPGIREFGLAGLHRRDLARSYHEFALVAPHCRFDDCMHTAEPGCAVRVAVRAGWISGMRYNSYQKILADLPE